MEVKRVDALRTNARKAAANLRKHGVSFDEAASVFFDPVPIRFYEEIPNGGDRPV
jgi:uncharacterized DUF497 family protein